MTNEEIHDVATRAAREAVDQTFLRLGICAGEPIEVQKDMAHLREWRTTTESVKRKGAVTVAGLIVSGLLAALWLGVKLLVARP